VKSKTKVLIVEHNLVDIELLEYELKKGGINYVSKVVETEKDYANALKVFVPDIILCDYSLPTFDGSTAFKMRESMAPEIPFIFVSGALGEINSVEFVENGVTDYALKDKLFTLSTKVKRALKESNNKIIKGYTEIQLTASEGKLARAQQIAHIGNWEWDFTSNVLTLSAEGCRIIRFPLTHFKLSYETWSSLIHPDDRGNLSETINKAKETLTDVTYQYRIVLQGGSVRHIYFESKFDSDTSGDVTGMYGIMQDITERKEAEEKIIKANRLYAFISQVNQTIVHVENQEILFRKACSIAIVCGKFKMAWIGMFENSDEDIVLVEQGGMEDVNIPLFTNALYERNGPQDHVLRTGNHYICNSLQSEFELEHWKPFGTKHGICSIMVLPLIKSNKVIGTFNLYAQEPDFFDTAEIALLEEVAGDISFALDMFEKATLHKQTEKQLIHNERRFRGLIEKSTDMKTLTNLEGEFIYCSPSITKVFGYSENELLQKPADSFFHPDDIPDLVLNRQYVLKFPGSSFYFQYRFLHKTGNWIWCEGSLTNMLHEPGILALVSNFQDISERKKADEQREFDKNNLFALINNTSDLMWSVDTDFKLITSNQPFNDFMKEVSGKEMEKDTNMLESALTGNEAERYKVFYQKAFAGETFTEIEHMALPVEYWSEVSFHPIFQDGNVIGTACHARNVTNIKKAEQLLRDSEAFNRGVLNSLSSHIAVIDGMGNIVAVNNSWKKFAVANGAGSLQRTAAGSNYFEVCEAASQEGDDIAANALKGIKDVMAGNLPQFYLEYPCHSPDQQRWFGMRASKFESNLPMVVVAHTNITERKQAADKQLTTSEELRHALDDINKIMDSSLDVICALDEAGYFTKVSAACETMWGYKEDELVGRAQMDFIYAEDKQRTETTTVNVMAGTNITNFGNRFIRKDGSLVSLVWSARWDAEDKIRYAVARDATEQKRSEKAFETERERFNELFLQAPSCIAILKGSTHIFEMANPLFLKLIGKKDVIGKTVKEVLPEVVEQGFTGLLDTVYSTGNTFSASEMLFKVDRENDGTLVDIYFNFIYQPYNNSSGNIEGIFFFGIDVTEQVTSRRILEERERRFRTLSEKNTDITTLSTAQGQLIYGSPSVTKTLGYELEEVLHEPVFHFIHSEDKLENMKELILTPGKSLFFQQRMLHKLGHWVWCEGIITNMLQEPGINALVSIFRDISERKLSETEREKMIADITQRNSTLEQFTYIVSHNLRAPIAKILGLASIMESESEENSYIIKKLVEETTNLDNVVKDINVIVSARLSDKEKMETVIFKTQLDQIKHVLDVEIKTSEAIITSDFTAAGEVFTLKSYLYSILYNLVSNAIKYRLPDVPLQITIQSTQDNKFICLSVKDNGRGIDLVKNGTKIFGLYKRFHGESIAGRGIGLNLVKTHAESMGGRVEVESEVNKGTTFKIYIPAKIK
jgi:PAS domain S-box-containing protein